MRTIRQQLLIYLFGGMVSATIIASIATYIEVRIETNELFDYQLRQIAAALPDEIEAGHNLPVGDEADEEVAVQVWDKNGKLLFTSGPTANVPYTRQLGFISIAVDGVGWRLYTENDHGRTIQIAQPKVVRRELATAMAIKALIPFILLIPILTFLIWYVVGRSMQPLRSLALAVESRSPDLLDALPDDRYSPELHPIVTALNSLLARLGQTLEIQRAFIADAAHELRTPLTALKLQLRLVEKEGDNEMMAIGFKKVHERLNRATHVVEQLLTLALHEKLNPLCGLKKLDPEKLIVDVVSDHALQAENKGIDLGVLSGNNDHLQYIAGDEDSLRIMLGNLVDNAVRYTPEGGRVDVAFHADGNIGQITISDDGPGIPVSDRARVFDRFYRREGTGEMGSGLGLFIAKTIADQHRAKIELGDGKLGGLMVTVSFKLITEPAQLSIEKPSSSKEVLSRVSI